MDKTAIILWCQATYSYKRCKKIGKRYALLLLSVTLCCLHATAQGQIKINFGANKEPLPSALTRLSKATGVNIGYPTTETKKAGNVTMEKATRTLEATLTLLLKGTTLDYKFLNGRVVIFKTPPRKEAVPAKENITIQGEVRDEKDQPLAGITVSVAGTASGTSTNDKGYFLISNVAPNATIEFSGVGYEKTIFPATTWLNVILNITGSLMENVTVSTGYQTLPKERATGSFDFIDNKLFNRRVSTDMLSRLEGIASSVRFQTNIPRQSNESQISIRGRSTLFSNTQPLIIVDNFPYDGDLSNINPNDVENITILKDAAAASIWGVRSANGVIVINTKKSKYNQPLNIEFNTNFTTGKRPDLFYNRSFLNASEYIDVEKFLFSKGFYNADLSNNTYPVVSPVVELLAKERSGSISHEEADAQINALRNYDVRSDLNKYTYRNSYDQQYLLSINGGGDRSGFRFSAGYDKNLPNLINNQNTRITLNSFNQFKPFKNVEAIIGISYIQTTANNNNAGDVTPLGKSAIYPYARLMSDDGQALATPMNYRMGFVDTAGNGKLLDWQYRALDEIHNANNHLLQNDIRITSSLKYNIITGLGAQINYQYEKQSGKNKNLQSQETYFSRNLINLYSQLSSTTVKRNIPLGEILDENIANLQSQHLRFQLDYNRTFGNHNFVGLAGAEQNETKTNSKSSRIYGYDSEIGAAVTNIDFLTRFPSYDNLKGNVTIPPSFSIGGTENVYVSYFSNIAYNFKNKYTISISGRIDQSNLFGVAINQKSVPLWSLGAAWNISKESFYHSDLLPELKFRATYGYNGNVNKTVSAYTTASYASSANAVGLYYASIQNPPNPNLRWEKVGMMNIAVDFATRNYVLSGSIEYYHKNAKDLFGNIPIAPSAGQTTFSGNVGSMKGDGVDIAITSRNINRRLKWNTQWLLSYNTDVITNYIANYTATTLLQSGDGMTVNAIAVQGKPVYGVYSYRWEGLDAVGDPLGYDPVAKQISKDYNAIKSNTQISDLIYNGPARPTLFGSLRNDFSMGSFSLSANITYKLHYFFRRSSIRYSSLFTYWLGNVDYSARWQQPGDEKTTNVPAMVYPVNSSREDFYAYSSVLVEKGDHIRLQDVQLSYTASRLKFLNTSIPQLQFYLYLNNLGIIWKANKMGIDPDYVTGYPNPKRFSVGVKVNL